MKAVLISIQPKWCEQIASCKKTIEVRKTHPKIDTPFKCYIYCTKGKGDCLWRWNGIWYDTQDPTHRPNRMDGKVIGEFICDKLVWVVSHPSIFAGHSLFHQKAIDDAGLTLDEAEVYANGNDVYGWHISNLVIYDKPKSIVELCKPCDRDPQCDCNHCKRHGGGKPVLRAPQSWCYVEELQ